MPFALAGALCCALATGATHAAEAKVPAGLAVFGAQCVACHQAGGAGMPGLAPALAGSFTSSISAPQGKRYVALVLVNGLSGRISSHGQVFMGAMPSQAALADADLAQLANYLARDLNGAPAAPFTADDFAKARAEKVTHKDLRDLRDQLPK